MDQPKAKKIKLEGEGVYGTANNEFDHVDGIKTSANQAAEKEMLDLAHRKLQEAIAEDVDEVIDSEELHKTSYPKTKTKAPKVSLDPVIPCNEECEKGMLSTSFI